ncbi:MAG: cob(I)yrinic acid a,c-diamide adenosyltransferase [Candidatus Aenigmarchaeota archaeon]|nr:cob(I)yrinic acid a,c-diamide adenosyltransferase [Candidatus Aenigmarchaeota archaeon]
MKNYYGDQGKTFLFSREKVDKDSARIEVIGELDELNSFVGLARSHIGDVELDKILKKVQQHIFTIGSDAATSSDTKKIYRVAEKEVEEIETFIEKYNKGLPKLKNFILPSGSDAASLLHVCRAVCRRAERRLVTLSKEEEVNVKTITFLNRLSDFFFVLARYMNMKSGSEEEMRYD